ncbi:hypothetical protein [Paenibacillus silviterrae]|uniref:hypothetical protein n=1 Tax=Paenibacillus silviterrae TaxID=3242194 RepID=UPI002542CA7F|nr:hypothetical protein [Paenibacillus chinjuensis]
MTIHELKQRMQYMKYLGFDESKRMWVYAYQEKFRRDGMYGLIAGKLNVTVLPSLEGLTLTKG